MSDCRLWAPEPLRVQHVPRRTERLPLPFPGPVLIRLPGQRSWIRATPAQAEAAWNDSRLRIPIAPELSCPACGGRIRLGPVGDDPALCRCDGIPIAPELPRIELRPAPLETDERRCFGCGEVEGPHGPGICV